MKGLSEKKEFGNCGAAFVDETVKGLRPLGNAKSHDITDKNQVYQVYPLDIKPFLPIPLTKELFLKHLVLLPRQADKRIQQVRQRNLDSNLYDEVQDTVEEEEDPVDDNLPRNASNNPINDIFGSQGEGSQDNSERRQPGVSVREWRETVDHTTQFHKADQTQAGPTGRKKRSAGNNPNITRRDPKRRNIGLSQTPSVSSQRQQPPAARRTSNVGSETGSLDFRRPRAQNAVQFYNGVLDEHGGPLPPMRSGRSLQQRRSGNTSSTQDGSKPKYDPCRPKPGVVVSVEAEECLKKFVLNNPSLPWGDILMDCDRKKQKSIGNLALKSEYGSETITAALKAYGIYHTPLDKHLAKLINNSLVSQSPEYYAEILQYLMGSNNGKQGRIEVEGKGANLEWWLFQQKCHGWQKQEGGNIWMMHALQGVFLAYREYLLKYAGKINATFQCLGEDAPNAYLWFDKKPIDRHHLILLCYIKVIECKYG